jgi:AcrR family transcriptional regulator
MSQVISAEREETALRPARQARSRQTLDRILQATRELLHEKKFEAITVAEIVQRARSSCGAFYARFPSKEALLPALYDAYSDELRTEATVWSDPSAWGERSLAVRVARMVRFVIRDFRATRPILRPLALYARQRPGAISPEARRIRREKHHAACAFLLECRDEITHPDPERAVDLAAYFMAAIGRDKILFGDAPHASSVEIEDAALEEELIRMTLAYLCGDSASGGSASETARSNRGAADGNPMHREGHPESVASE